MVPAAVRLLRIDKVPSKETGASSFLDEDDEEQGSNLGGEQKSLVAVKGIAESKLMARPGVEGSIVDALAEDASLPESDVEIFDNEPGLFFHRNDLPEIMIREVERGAHCRANRVGSPLSSVGDDDRSCRSKRRETNSSLDVTS